MNVMDLKAGDVVFVIRNKLHVRDLYRHYGVYVGDGRIVHFTGSKGHEINPHLAFIQETSLETFLAGDVGGIDRRLSRAFSREEVVRRAKSRVGKGLGTYNLMLNNCEHFASWCATGIYRSNQVEHIAARLLGANGRVLLAHVANRVASDRWSRAVA